MLYDFNFGQHPVFMLVLSGMLVLSFLIYLFYYLVFFRKLARKKNTKAEQAVAPSFPVSIVIAAKNEYLNLKENLPFLLNQDYDDFEIVIVDDHSTDDTWDLLCAFRIHNPHLRIIRLTDSVVNSEGKKFPLSVGIKEARHSVLLLTDADCRPTGPDWITAMAAAYSSNTGFVLGYGKYYQHRGCLNKLIRFDTMHVAMQYFSAALSRFPYMGVGRNLSYKKEIFIHSNGFVSHYDLMSGDDDLFVSEHATRNNTATCTDPKSFTFSEPKHRFGDWWQQKKRHFTTGPRYHFKHKFYLGFYSLNVLLFPLLAAVLLLNQYQIIAVSAIVLIKWMVQWIIYAGVTKKLKERKILLISPVLETILALLYSLIHISNLINKPGRWK